MAITMLGASNDRIEYGDLAALAGLTEFTVALTVKPVAVDDGDRLVGQWGGSAGTRSFLVSITDTNEISFLITSGGTSSTFRGRKTASFNVTTQQYRFVFRYIDSTTVDIWADGSQIDDADFFTTTVTSLQDGSGTVFIGRAQDSGNDGLDGDFSECAMWDHAIPDAFAIAYGKGISPAHYRDGGFFYAPIINADNPHDIWGGAVGTKVGINPLADADHPRMIYPSRPHIITAVAAAPGGFVPYPNPRYALTGGMQPMNAGV